MTLRQQITQDLKDAMKRGDVHERDTLRSLDSMIKNEEIAQKKRDDGLGDDDVVALVKRAVKQRKDSADQFRKGDRSDLAEKEEEEILILEKYLPDQMSEADVEKIVKEVIAQTGSTSRSDMGKVMGLVMNKIGNASDGNIVKSVAVRLLDE